jgi:hypothetical protein
MVQMRANSSMDRAPNVPGRKFPSSNFGEEKGGADVEKMISLQEPVLKIDGELVLLIPLNGGGNELADCSRGISEVQGDFLKIVIPEWLAGLLRVDEGDFVIVHNTHGKFHIHAVSPQLVH